MDSHNAQKAADMLEAHLNTRLTQEPEIIADDSGVRVTLRGLHVDESLRKSTVQAYGQTHPRQQAESTGVFVESKFTLLSPENQLAAESKGQMNIVENYARDNLVTLNNGLVPPGAIKKEFHEDPESRTATAVIHISTEHLQDLSDVAVKPVTPEALDRTAGKVTGLN